MKFEDAMECKLMRKKTNVMRISRLPTTMQIVMHHKQLENVEYLDYLGSIRMMQATSVL